MNFRLCAVIYAFMRAKPLTHIRIRVILQEPMVMVKAMTITSNINKRLYVHDESRREMSEIAA